MNNKLPRWKRQRQIYWMNSTGVMRTSRCKKQSRKMRTLKLWKKWSLTTCNAWRNSRLSMRRSLPSKTKITSALRKRELKWKLNMNQSWNFSKNKTRTLLINSFGNSRWILAKYKKNMRTKRESVMVSRPNMRKNLCRPVRSMRQSLTKWGSFNSKNEIRSKRW